MARGKHISIVSLALVFLATGCIVRTYTVVKDRPDLELSEGNQGYLQGAPAQTPVVEKTTRTTYVAEIEMGQPYEEKVIVEQYRAEKSKKKASKQNKAAKAKVVSLNETVSEEAEEKTSIVSDGKGLTSAKDKSVVVVGKQNPVAPVSKTEEKVPKVKTYVVKAGDTMEKIAARPEVYGDKKKWYKIYKANEGKLKEPNKIFPGQVLNIPE